MSNLSIKEYASAKHLPEDFLRSFGLTDSNSGMVIPYHRQNGSTAYSKTRHTLLRINKKPQFTYQKDSSETSIPFGLGRLSESVDTVYLTEGETDYFTMVYAGFNCLGIPGAKHFKEDFLKFLSRFKKIVILVHNDEAGKKLDLSIRQFRSSLPQTTEMISISFEDYGNDANDCWIKVKNIHQFQQIIHKKVAATYDVYPKVYSYDDDIISVDHHSISLVKTKTTTAGVQRLPPTPVADFVIHINKQKVVFNSTGSARSRMLHAKAVGNGWSVDFEISIEQFSSISKFQEAIEMQLGTKAKTYRRNAFYILKSVAMSLGSSHEEVYVDAPGFQQDCYIYGSYKIDAKGIHNFPHRLVSNSDIASLDKLDFKNITRSEAVYTLRQYIENLELAYAVEAAVCGIIAPALALLCNSTLPYIKGVRALLEYLADQGKGKTELNKHIHSFFGPAPEDSDFNKTSDSFASIEDIIHKFSASGFKYNDYKGTAGTQSVRDLAERVQNWIDGLAYTRYRKDKVSSTNPFRGLVSCNGQDRLSAQLSSLASRAITFEVASTGARTNFDLLVSLRNLLNGVTPHLIFEFFFTEAGQNFLTSRFQYHRDSFAKTLKAEFSVERMVGIAALTNVALDLMWKFAYDNAAENRLAIHQETLKHVHLRQVSYVREADLVSQLVSSLIAGLRSGIIFLGKDRPSHCNASAVSVGRLPNFDENKVWINPQPLLNFIRGAKGPQEIASTTQSMITRELKSRNLLISSKSRATTRVEQGSELGWLLKFDSLPNLESCLKELAGLYIPSDNEGEQ